jgi:cytochrome P450
MELLLKFHRMTSSSTFQLCIPGFRSFVTCDPENVNALLTTQFKDFEKGSDSQAQLGPYLGNGILGSDGIQWSNARALLGSLFSKQRVDLEIFENHMDNMVDLLPQSGKTIDLMDWFFRFSLDVTTEYLFGESVNSLTNPKVPSQSSRN